MIINCTYNTHADMGIFSSDAKFNTENGVVFDIQDCNDEGMEHIDTIHKETVSFIFNEMEYEYTLSYVDEIGEYQIEDVDAIKLFSSINLSEKLEKEIPKKENKSKNKI